MNILSTIAGLGVMGLAIYFVADQIGSADDERMIQLGRLESELSERESRIAGLSRELDTQRGRVDSLQTELTHREAEIGQLNETVNVQATEIDRLDTAVRLLKVEKRVARVHVVEQREQEGRLKTKVEFVEVDPNDPEGRALGEPKVFEIDGEFVYIDALVMKVQDRLVEAGDDPLLRSASICLFKRIYGRHEEIAEARPLDPDGEAPLAYAGSGAESSTWERELWTHFWEYANDPEKMEKAGLRAMHGEAPYIKAVEGKTYQLSLRASGGLEFRAIEWPQK